MPGYLDAELFSFMLPLFVLVLAIGSGARAFAGEEDAGRLELVLSYPVRRSRAVLAKGDCDRRRGRWSSALSSSPALALLDPVFGLELAAGKTRIGARRPRSARHPVRVARARRRDGGAQPRTRARRSGRARRRRLPRRRACTSSPAGSIPSACSPRSGGSARDRSRTARGDGACSSSPLPRSRCSRPRRCSSSGAT